MWKVFKIFKWLISSDNLTTRANRQLGIVTSFVNKIQTASDDAKGLQTEAQEEINKARKIQKDCQQVTIFADKVLKI